MKTVRTAVTYALVLLMGGGYLASLYAYFFGNPTAYIEALDASPVPLLSLVLLLAVVILAFLPDPEEEPQ